MSSDLSEELAAQTERAQRAEAALQTYKRESKEMEQLLEGEAAKKEAEIRKMMNQSIMKEKQYKAQKAEFADLQAENARLKEEITQLQSQSKAVDPTVIAKLEEETSNLKKEIQSLKKQLFKQKEATTALTDSDKKNHIEWEKKQTRFKQDIETANKLAEQYKNANQILNEKLNNRAKNEQNQKNQKKSSKNIQLQRQNSKKEIKLPKQSFEKEKFQQKIKQLQESKRKLQQALTKNDKIMKDLRSKNQILIDENQTLQARISAFGTMSNCNSQSAIISPFSLKSVIEEEDVSWNRINYSCLLLTKPHYASPFLELDEQKKLLKIYKSTRTGCFEKSMGIYKHKFDVLSYQQDRIIDPIVKNITESQEVSHHSIIFYGVKKSSKKYLMAKFAQKLKTFLLSKLEEEGEEPSSIFTIRSQEQEKNYVLKGFDKTSISDVIDKVISKGSKSEKSKQKYGSPKKGQSKPKVRYFNFKTSNFYLEIGTSSFTNLSFRDKITPTNMLNNILYSKLPDVLQSTISQKYLILTLNPIVDLYDECRNTLSTTFCRETSIQTKEEDESKDWRASPAREELNEVAKKKLENIERQNEQTSLKIRKLEEQCGYFKSRFDELQFRLKNLLNTHSGQNSYLKKSPVTLSYQKLLKFVHSVQSRTATSLNATLLGNSMLMKSSSNANMEKDYESPEAL